MQFIGLSIHRLAQTNGNRIQGGFPGITVLAAADCFGVLPDLVLGDRGDMGVKLGRNICQRDVTSDQLRAIRSGSDASCCMASLAERAIR